MGQQDAANAHEAKLAAQPSPLQEKEGATQAVIVALKGRLGHNHCSSGATQRKTQEELRTATTNPRWKCSS